MVLNPGESTTVKVAFTMHAGMDGFHDLNRRRLRLGDDFRLHLNSNDPTMPSREIVILSNWVQ